jgi:DNA-binding HxlR family transcriptional regulator
MRCRRCTPVPEEVRRAADLLERRWLLQVLYAAHSGAERFNESRQVLRDIPPRTLAARLSELEDAGLLRRVVVPSRPPRVEYQLTDAGRRMKALVDALGRWASAHAASRPV